MSSNSQDDNDPHSSGYEGDVSDNISETSSNGVHPSDTTGKATTNEDDPEYGYITIGCDLHTLREAGAQLTSSPRLEPRPNTLTQDGAEYEDQSEGDRDDDSQFGTIWIGVNLRDLGLNGNHNQEDSDDDATTEHIEDINNKDTGSSGADKTNGGEGSEGSTSK
ncbi:hypothetical protein BJX99DRAFT_76607 [Aspergillus californicus]